MTFIVIQDLTRRNASNQFRRNLTPISLVTYLLIKMMSKYNAIKRKLKIKILKTNIVADGKISEMLSVRFF